MKNTLIKMLSAGVVFLIGLTICFFLFSQGEDVKHNQMERLAIQNVMDKKATVPVLDAINTRNSQIKNISCRVRAIAQMPGKRPAKLNGSLCYEKDRKFRMSLDSFMGPELDIGSDGSQFWFWSGRMKNPGLYWSTYENFQKTRLKTPFNPTWLSHCLSIDQINYSDAVIDQTSDRWRIMRKTTNAKGEQVTVATYVDAQRGLITGHGMYNKDGELEASSEVQQFNGTLPSKISFIWHKENASMVWYLENMKSNTPIDAQMWVMPNITPKIDMSRD